MDALRRLLAQFRTFWGKLSTVRRVAAIAVLVAIVVSLGLASYLSQDSDYRPLFNEPLTAEEISQITAKLTAQSIPYKLNSNGTGVRVPEDRRAQAIVVLAADGLPTRGGKGYELFDETSMTTTPFVQTVNYQRALQAELGRSIMQLEPVQSARVLIARPDPTPFMRSQQPPTASVVLKLKPSAVMNRTTAGSIVSLVARSVEGLKPENVTVVDSSGRLLSDPNAAEREAVPTPQLEYRRELETYLSTRAEELLNRHLGNGRAIVRVSADINFQQLKEKRKTIYPDEKAIVAERLTTAKNAAGSSRGVAGAASNVPRAGVSLAGGSGGGGGSSNEEVTQIDYNYSESVKEMEDRMAAVTRLSVAAMVDLSAPGEGGRAMSVEDAQSLIQRAVGFRSGRDEVKVSNVSLIGEPAAPEPDAELVRLQRMQGYVSLARNVCLALAVVLAVAFVPLVLLRRRAAATPAAAAAAADEERRQAAVNRLASLAREDPERVASVFRLLLGTGSR